MLGPVGGVDPQPGCVGLGADHVVDAGNAGGGDHQPDAVEVDRTVGPAAVLDDERPVEGCGDLRGDQPDPGAGSGQPLHLAKSDAAAAHDEHVHIGQVEKYGVVEHGRDISRQS